VPIEANDSNTMDTINISKEYVTVFLNPNHNLSKQVRAFAIAEYKFVNIIDVLKDKPTALQYLDITTKCNVAIENLFDKNAVLYQQKVKDISSFSTEDAANMLAEAPELIRTPFVVKGNTLKFFESVADLT
jgi:arsenate reductase-like glutaredoxin family protein